MRRASIAAVTLLVLAPSGCAGDPEIDPRGQGESPSQRVDGVDPGVDVEAEMDVVFSPQPAAQSHNTRVAALIGRAERSIDVAMYSFSDAAILDALGEAVSRGVSVRFLFDTASADQRLSGDARAASKSGRLERRGVDVRYVNKILHHKLMIVDGPRDDLDAASTAWVATGSANWSHGAATRYDENTLFSRGHAELALRLQAELDMLWQHSRDFVLEEPPFEPSPAVIDEEAIPDDPGFDAFFTSDNFEVRGDTFSTNGSTVVGDEIVRAIGEARESIHIASGHLRSRPIAEALMAKKESLPAIDIRVYLDGQEYISARGHADQVNEVERCLARAGEDERAIRACRTRGFLFGYAVGHAGIDVRYKYYAYRWDASYAKQMHHKYMILDGDTLYTGTYNLSDNAERDTFENLLVFRGPAHRPLIERFQENFARIWETGRAEGLLARLSRTVRAAAEIPLVFEPMALSWEEVTGLKTLIRASCPAVNTPEYRSNPVAHQTCPRR